MGDLFRRGAAIFVAGFVGATLAATLALSSVAQAQSEPPGRVGRLAFTNGTVSFHDNEQSEWAPAVVNTPLSTGDSLWTEPNARSEISLAGTRIRMAGATELDMLAVDDSQTRLQVDQGRIDVKTQAMDPSQPYQIATPRGTISLLQQGDYYVEAGSTEDPTQIGVRSGAAQIQGLNGQVLAVRAGEVGEVTGDAATPQLRTIHTAPPTLPASWADRDRQVSYDQPPQYLTAGVTGYEDLNQYGTWVDDSNYGNVWIPRSVPSGWAPYRTGHWAYEQPWGWTWIDDQPWGFAALSLRPLGQPRGPLDVVAAGAQRAAGLCASAGRLRGRCRAVGGAVPGKAARRSAGSRWDRVKPTCRPTRPTAIIISASTGRRASRTRS